MQTNIAIIIAASKAFLCEPLPENWYSLDTEEQDEFLTLNAWQPFENDSAEKLWSYIICHADSITELFGVAEEGAVKMAIDCKFPSDLNEFSIEDAIEYNQNNPSTDKTEY